MSEEDKKDDGIEHAENQAKVVGLEYSGSSGSYTFEVTIESPDEGCNQYADWWEVIKADSSLVYRRILAHSHVDEQPFSRSGGPVDIDGGDLVYIRAHMNNLGYGSIVWSGSIDDGFVADSLSSTYALGAATTAPLPSSCAF